MVDGASDPAGGRLRAALRCLADTMPFAAAVLQHAKITLDDTVPTAGVSVRPDGPHVRVSPTFFTSITVEEAAGVLAHEVCHLVLVHCGFRPRGPDGRRIPQPDPMALMLACEACAVELQGDVLPLPGQPVTPDVLGLPPDEDATTRYWRLVRLSRLIGGLGTLSALQPVDDHSTMDEADGDALWPRMVVRHVATSAMSELSRDQVRAMPPRLADHLEGVVRGDAAALDCPATAEESNVDWRRILAGHLWRSRDRVETRSRPHRRYPELVGIVPGKRRVKGNRVVSIVDTSASMSGVLEDIERFLARQHADGFDVWVIHIDTEVRHVGRYVPGRRRFHGGGGTDLRAAFSTALLGEIDPDVVCVFTDCGGPMGTSAPSGVDLIWCLVPGAPPPPGEGRIVHLETTSGHDR